MFVLCSKLFFFFYLCRIEYKMEFVQTKALSHLFWFALWSHWLHVIPAELYIQGKWFDIRAEAMKKIAAMIATNSRALMIANDLRHCRNATQSKYRIAKLIVSYTFHGQWCTAYFLWITFFLAMRIISFCFHERFFTLRQTFYCLWWVFFWI